VAEGSLSVLELPLSAPLRAHLTKMASSTQCREIREYFIYPGYKFKAVDALITNFHLPESTLLMLISAFYDRGEIMKAYKTAVEEKYRFFSFGDAMFIE